jgi:phosphoglycolate phosphatase
MLNEAARRFGFRQVSQAEIEALRELGNREIVRFFRIPAWKMPAIARYVRGRMAEEADQIALFDGVPLMLEALKGRGVRIAVVSSNGEANIRRILGDAAHLVDDFDCGAGLFGKAKRFRRVIRRSRVSPADTVCVGDETRDIEAAKAVGASSAAVTWGYARTSVLETFAPTVLVDEMAALARL